VRGGVVTGGVNIALARAVLTGQLDQHLAHLAADALPASIAVVPGVGVGSGGAIGRGAHLQSGKGKRGRRKQTGRDAPGDALDRLIHALVQEDTE
jgi:hypothetical protein